MNDLTIFLIISGIVVVVIIGVFTYLKDHQKLKGEIGGFDRHKQSIDDVLLSPQLAKQTEQKFPGHKNIVDEELPSSFTTKDDNSESQWVDNTRIITPKKTKLQAKKIKVPFNNSKPQETSPLEHEVKLNKPVQKISVVHQPLPDGMSDMIVALSIQRDNHLFSGEEIKAACDANNMIFGEMNVFHFPAEKKASTYALFSMANMAQPGTFDIDNLFNLTTPGVSLFMQLPLPMDCLAAYNIFVKQAKALSQSLNAELYDEKFNLLTPQIIGHTIEKINAFQHEMLKAHKQSSLV